MIEKMIEEILTENNVNMDSFKETVNKLVTEILNEAGGKIKLCEIYLFTIIARISQLVISQANEDAFRMFIDSISTNILAFKQHLIQLSGENNEQSSH